MTVLVTGGTGDIGQAIVRCFAGSGDKVCFTYYENAAGAELLCKETGASGFFCDISRHESVEVLFREALKKSEIDVLINNAGISDIRMFTDIGEHEWQRMLDVNLSGAFRMCRNAVPSMIRRKSGCIINIASVWGNVGASCEVHYSAAKAGLIGFTKALAKELGPSNIRVNAVSPGVIEGDMNNSSFTHDEMAELAERTPLCRNGRPADVAHAVRYLAEADYVTGQVLTVDGGFAV
ncbi:3-oxoacyl-ACP reductase [Clostridia bacterium]|nr:3-oxoacyl-ACP reductase [Clostridia bacterium]